MSEAELTAISENIEPTTGAEKQAKSNAYVGTALYKSGYTAMDVKFTAYYVFNAGKLVAVSLSPVDLENWPKVNIAIGQIYGTPDDHNGAANETANTKRYTLTKNVYGSGRFIPSNADARG